MASKLIQADQVLRHAIEALQRGDKHTARHLAQIAVSLEPGMEDPWLILAAVARPRASLIYLERALEINPQSERARKGLQWAWARSVNTPAEPTCPKAPTFSPLAEMHARPRQVDHKGKSFLHLPSWVASTKWVSFPGLFLILVACLVVAWAVWPGTSSRVLAAIHTNPTASNGSHFLSWSHLDLMKPTYTPLPSVTPALTATFTETASPSPTPFSPDTATITPTSLPKDTPQPAVVQPQAEFVNVQPPAQGEKLIVVSIHEQRLYAYQGSTLVFRFIASTGSGNSTLPGTFHVLDKIPTAFGADWDFWMPDWMGIYYAGDLENGIHALPLLPNGQYLWGNVLGTPITYGCVVLGVQEAQELYNWADVGTTVQISP